MTPARPHEDDPAVNAVRDYFALHGEGVACAYVFGSRARGEARPDSDVDVAVLYSKDPPRTLAGLGVDQGDDLRERLHRPVDLVVMNRASPELVHHILRDGVLVYEGDSNVRVAFEVKRRNEYFDVLPYLREYRLPPGARTR